MSLIMSEELCPVGSRRKLHQCPEDTIASAGLVKGPFLCSLWKLNRLSSAFAFTYKSIHTHLMMNTYQWHTKCLSKAQAILTKYHTLEDLNSTPLFSHVFIFSLI